MDESLFKQFSSEAEQTANQDTNQLNPLASVFSTNDPQLSLQAVSDQFIQAIQSGVFANLTSQSHFSSLLPASSSGELIHPQLLPINYADTSLNTQLSASFLLEEPAKIAEQTPQPTKRKNKTTGNKGKAPKEKIKTKVSTAKKAQKVTPVESIIDKNGSKPRNIRTSYTDMDKIDKALMLGCLGKNKDPVSDKAVKKALRLRRAAEREELRGQLKAIQENRYKPVFYYQPPPQVVYRDPSEATTFNGRFRKIVPKDPNYIPQGL